MKLFRYLAVLSAAALMLPALAAARAKNEHTVDITNPVQVAHQQLKPGTYKVEWQNTGPSAHVTFLQNKKVVASVPATIKTNDAKVTQDDIITDHNGAKHAVLREIDFSHGKDALIFSKG